MSAAASRGRLSPDARDALVGLRQHRAERLPEPAERRAIRQSAGVAVAELAVALGVSEATVYTWETGTRIPSRKARDRYAEALAILRGEAA